METPDNFIAVILALVAFMMIATIARLISEKIHIPFPIMLVFSGVALVQLPVLPEGSGIFLEANIAQQTIIYILLPILIFEAAYRFDVSKFAANLTPIILMALPGVFFSTFVIMTILVLVSDLRPEVALLLGILLSATDPSATIAIFKELGAPKDLVTIVEGESLLNDATVIALFKIALLLLAIDLTPYEIVLTSLWKIAWLFGAGALCGWVAGKLLLGLMKKLPDEPFIEISISLIIAVGSFILIEEYVGASGIVALTVCGLLLSHNMPLPISHYSSRYLDNFWTYLSDLTKAFIFILVGMWLDISLIAEHWLTTIIVVASMLIARSILVYGVLPFFGQLKRHAYSLPRAYQHICVWGGLRGAVTLALAMLAMAHATALAPDQREILLSVAMGAVAFTIVIQGLSLTPLARRLALNTISLEDHITRKELLLSVMNVSKKALSALVETPFSSSGAPQELMSSLESNFSAEQKQLERLYQERVGAETLYQRLIMKGLSIESGYLYLLSEQGIISSEIYQFQKDCLDQKMDALRHQYRQPDTPFSHVNWLHHLFGRKKNQRQEILFQYEVSWARLLTAEFALAELEELMEEQPFYRAFSERILGIWNGRYKKSENMIHKLEKTHPELTAEAQRRWLQKMLNTVHNAYLNKLVHHFLISSTDGDAIKAELVVMMSNGANKKH